MTTREILRIAPFRRVWMGQAISQLGDALYYVVFMFMVKKITGSNAMVGYVGAAQSIPYLILSPYGGVIADRLDRRRVMLLSDLLSGGLLVGFGAMVLALGRAPLPAIFVVAVALAATRVFFMPAKSASIPSLVGADALVAANGLSSATQSIMPLLSLALSASVLSMLYRTSAAVFFSSAILLNALSFLASAAYIVLLPPLAPKRERIAGRTAFGDARDGIAYVRRRHELFVLLILAAVMNLMVSPFFVVYIAANDLWFHGRPEMLAWFEMAYFAGMIAGSVLVSRTPVRRPGLSFILSTTLVGATVAAMAASPHMGLFILWNILAGVAIPYSQVPMSAYTQAAVEDGFRGRVSSVFGMLLMGVQPIGLALGGILVDRAGVVGAFAIMGAGMGLAGLAGLLDTRFRRMTLPSHVPAPETAQTSLEPVS